jgi:hypothetical protein
LENILNFNPFEKKIKKTFFEIYNFELLEKVDIFEASENENNIIVDPVELNLFLSCIPNGFVQKSNGK